MKLGKGKPWVATATNREVYDKIKLRARRMRKRPTPAEKILWNKLRNKQLQGFRFRRQHPIGRFIVDFYCREVRLVIEVDGSVHDTSEAIEYDEARQTFLEHRGLTVLRFSNAEVINNTQFVLCCIKQRLLRVETGRSYASVD